MPRQETTLAHNDGNVPIITITIPELDEYYVGQLIYFFEMACAISGDTFSMSILSINPELKHIKQTCLHCLINRGSKKPVKS